LPRWKNGQALINERFENYRKQMNQYEPEVQEWLVNFYEEHDKQVNHSIIHFLKMDGLEFKSRRYI